MILSSEASSSVSSSRPLKASRESKKSASYTIRRLPSEGSRKRKQPANSVFTIEGENLVGSSEIEDNATLMERKRRRTCKDLAILSPDASSSVSSSRPLKASREPKISASYTIRWLPSEGSRKRKQPTNSVFTTEGENLVGSSEIDDNATLMKRKRRRTCKDLAILSPDASSSVSSSHPLEASIKPKNSASPTIHRLPSEGSRKRKQPANAVFSTEGENLDLVSSSKIEDNATSMKRKRGRPRKNLAILSSEVSSSVSSSPLLEVSKKLKKKLWDTIFRYLPW